MEFRIGADLVTDFLQDDFHYQVSLEFLPPVGDPLFVGMSEGENGFAQRFDSFARFGRNGNDDRRLRRRGKIGIDFGDFYLRPPQVRLVDDENIGDFDDSGFKDLDLVAAGGSQHSQNNIGRVNDFDFRLADTDRLDEDHVFSRRFEQLDDFRGRIAQTAQLAAAGDTPDKHVGVVAVLDHPDPVAQ